MRKFFYLGFVLCLFSLCRGESSSPQNSSPLLGDADKLPIQIQAVREGGSVLLSIQPSSGFGIQIEAPNQIQVTEGIGLKILETDLKFSGTKNPDKPDYYQQIRPLSLEVEGKGSINLSGKIFYCDYSKNICLPGKLNRSIAIP